MFIRRNLLTFFASKRSCLAGHLLLGFFQLLSQPAILLFEDLNLLLETFDFGSQLPYNCSCAVIHNVSCTSSLFTLSGVPREKLKYQAKHVPNDSSGMGNHGTAVGSPKYSWDAAPTGLANSHSLDLDGRHDFIQVEHHESLNAANAVTIAMWVKLRSYPGFWPKGNDWSQLLNKGNVWGKQNYMVGFGAYFYLHSDGMGVRIPCLDDTVRTPGQWHHLAVVLDADKKQGRIYFNGVLDHTVFNVPDVQINSDPPYIGRGDPGNPTKIDGQIDDVRLYTRPLSDEEIAALVPGAVVNEAPSIDAGQDMISSTLDVALHGVFSDRGGPATGATACWTVWRKVRGPGTVNFDEPYESITTASFERPGTYVLEFQGSDGGHLVRDTTIITIQD